MKKGPTGKGNSEPQPVRVPPNKFWMSKEPEKYKFDIGFEDFSLEGPVARCYNIHVELILNLSCFCELLFVLHIGNKFLIRYLRLVVVLEYLLRFRDKALTAFYSAHVN